MPRRDLRLRLLGPFEAHLDGQRLPRLRSRKGAWLLALLVLRHGREVERRWLAGTLWPESSEAHAYGNLRITLADLRRALGTETARLTAPRPNTLLLDLEGAEVDLVAFDRSIARSDPGSMREAVRLYQGILLEGCDEEWVLPERQAREQAYLDALERLAAAEAAAESPRAAVAFLRRAVALDPLRESAWRALMATLAESGEPAAAIEVYRGLRLRLSQELEAEPEAETTALFQRIRSAAREPVETRKSGGSPLRAEARKQSPAGAIPAAPAPGHRAPIPVRTLPRPLTDFIGRRREVRELVAMLVPGGAAGRLLTLTGTGGVGKTRLALQVAAAAARGFEEGACFVDLAPLRDPELVVQALAAATGVREPAGASPGGEHPLTGAVLAALASRQLLLVLDNCEHLVEACASLTAALLAGCCRLCVLATSRQPLELPGETVWRVPSLPPDEAERLFVERGDAMRPGAPLPAPAVAEICRHLDGLPLAIELAAARLKVLTAEQIAARLATAIGARFTLLTTGSRTALSRQQTLRATMDWSYQLLDEEERALLRHLSLFAGSWTLEAAEAVAGEQGSRGAEEQGEGSPLCSCSSAPLPLRSPAPLLPCADVLDLLAGLVDKSLLTVEEQDRVARYRLLETTREYARECLEKEGEFDRARQRYVEYFTSLAEEADRHLRGPEQAEWIRQLEREHPNLRAALALALGTEGGRSDSQPSLPRPRSLATAALRLAVALWPFWALRGTLSEGRAQLAVALEHAGEAAEPRLRLKGYQGAGTLARLQGDSAAARHWFTRNLALARELQDRRQTGAALGNLGLVACDQRDYDTARALFEECLALCRELDDQRGIAGSLTNLGAVAGDLGDLAAARRLYEASLTRWRELGDRRVVAAVLSNLGPLACKVRDWKAARRYVRECLLLCQELGSRRDAAFALEAAAALCLASTGGREGAERAARLHGAADALRAATGAPRPATDRTEFERAVGRAQALLGEPGYTTAWSAGWEMDLEEALTDALEAAG